MSNKSAYYVARKWRYLWEFDLIAKSARSVLDEYFTEEVNVLLTETRREFENLIPQLPYIGGKQPFTEFIVFTGMLLAIYRVNKARGKTAEEIGELVYKIGWAFLRANPAFLKLLFGRMNFSRLYLNRLRKYSIESHQKKYPDGYVINFIEGDGKTFDYGVDYIERASCKFLAKQGAAKLAPYLCPVDILYSEALGWGLTRTMTLAEGAEKCDFRFKKGGQTKVSVPLSMQHIISQNQ